MRASRHREGLAARLFPAGLAAVLVGFGLYFDHAASSTQERQMAAIDDALTVESASPEVRDVARWAVATQDSSGLPFVIVDAARARRYTFDPQGFMVASARTAPSIAYVIERGQVARRLP